MRQFRRSSICAPALTMAAIAAAATCPAQSHPPVGELSALEPVRSAALLEALGAERALWTVGDEGAVERNIGVFVWPRGGSAWEFRVAHCDPGTTPWPKTDDAEAMCRIGNRVAILGSHFGKKSGPLEEKRAFLASFGEADVTVSGGVPTIRGLQVRTDGGALWREANRALGDLRGALIPAGPGEGVRLVAPRAAELGIAPEASRGWRAINVEAAAVTSSGELMLGLRYPCTAEGAPVLLVLPDAAGIISGTTKPVVSRVLLLKPPADAPGPLGVRALAIDGESRWALLGGLDSDPSKSVLMADHPGAGGDSAYLASWTAAQEHADTGTVDAGVLGLGKGALEGIVVGAGGASVTVIEDTKGPAYPREVPLVPGPSVSPSP